MRYIPFLQMLFTTVFSLSAEQVEPPFTHPDLDKALAQGYAIEKVVTNPPYTAIALRAKEARGILPGRVFIFTQNADTFRLLGAWGGEDDQDWLHAMEPQFTDVNGDGKLEFIFHEWTGGNADFGQWFRIFSLGDTFTEIGPKLPEYWVTDHFEDINKDGNLELIVLVAEYSFYTGDHPSSPYCRRIYTWDKTQSTFVDSSHKFPLCYVSEIARLKKNLPEQPDRNDPSGYWEGQVIDILLNYWCTGWAEEGWPGYQDAIDGYIPFVSEDAVKSLQKHKADLYKRLQVAENIASPPTDRIALDELRKALAAAKKQLEESDARSRKNPQPQFVRKDLPAVHTIMAGESLWSIAAYYYGGGEKWPEIEKANPGLDPTSLRVGDKITIPALEQSPAPSAP